MDEELSLRKFLTEKENIFGNSIPKGPNLTAHENAKVSRGRRSIVNNQTGTRLLEDYSGFLDTT